MLPEALLSLRAKPQLEALAAVVVPVQDRLVVVRLRVEAHQVVPAEDQAAVEGPRVQVEVEVQPEPEAEPEHHEAVVVVDNANNSTTNSF